MPEENRIYCMNCFSVMDADEPRCARCGWKNEGQRADALSYGTLLNNRYLLGQAVRENGAGFTYAALDRVGKQKVELREFFPGNIAFRDPNGVTVKPAAGMELAFDDYLSEFERYTEKLKTVSGIDGVADVLDAFSANNTQYVVFRFTESVSLRRYIEKNGPLRWEDCESLFLPLVRSLSAMSARNVDHLGISPDTLRITKSRRLILSDFEMPAVRRAGTDLVEDIYPGCWAIEQYSRSAICDEVTDVYGMCASLFFAVSGEAPQDAPKRKQDPRLMISRAVMKDLPGHVVSAIANGLQVDAERRTSSFSRLYAELSAAPRVMEQVQEIETTRALPTGKRSRPHRHSLPLFVWLVLSFVITFCGITAVMGLCFPKSEYSPQNILKSFREPLFPETGTRTFELPALVGETLERVQLLCETESDYAFTLDVKEEMSETVPAGTIIEQFPEAGTQIRNGESVRVKVSLGSSARPLPDVAGEEFSVAKDRLEADGFTVSVRYVADDSVEQGTVLGYWEGHEPGETMPFGSAVQLLVSGEEDEE